MRVFFVRLGLVLGLLGAPLWAHAQAYKCRQPGGSLSIQDKPCPSSADGSSITLPREREPQTPPPTSPRAESRALQSRTADADTRRAIDELKASNAQMMAEQKAQRCNTARQQLGVAKEQRPIYRRDNAGNRVYVEDNDRAAVISRAEQRVSSDCQ